ncbi:hypothetical protein CARUB_v10007515mg [Capsella rubella]|uniref:KIB1-4 beta-propeller domain-containing protein n=1 Tax=Capsella rubella TaxID=81985 RepID=R0H2K2_9BRAS|nr:hypothetical protein CARUB_v10007515mg [Capsella rubella]
MAQLIINRVFKPSVCKNILRHTNVRMFSSTTHFSSTPAYPFLLIDHILNIQHSSLDGRVTTEDLYKEKKVCINDKKLIEEVSHAMTVGFSRDGVQNVTVYLPSLPTGCKIQNVAMSSLPVRDKDWVVAVKLSGSRLSLCRPFGSSKWINIETKCINPLSSLMFSKTDERFYIPSAGSKVCVYKEMEKVNSCSMTDHLVESPTGQLFLVKWYSKEIEDFENETLMPLTEKFMVTMMYTEYIGDLCIFIGHSEAFCVPASASYGLNPNCIYFVGHNFGVYDLATKTCTTLYTDDDDVPLRNLDFPYWPPPY